MRDGVTRLVVLISALTFLDLVVWFCAVPLLPRWKHDLGLSGAQAGTVLAAYGVAVLALSIPVGHLADRVGARRLTIGGALVFALTTPLMAFADTYGELLGLRAVQGAFSAITWTAGLSWLIASVAPAERPRALAIVNGTAASAAVFGPFVGGPLVGLLGLRTAMLAVGAVVLAAGAWALFEPARGSEARTEHAVLVALRASVGHVVLRASFAMILFISVAMGAQQLVAPLHLRAAGLSPAEIGWVFTLGSVGSAAVAFTLARSRGELVWRIRLARRAGAAVLVALAALALAPPVPAYVLLVATTSTLASVLFVVGYPLCSAGAEHAGLGQGVALGALNTLWAAGSVAAPVLAGVLVDAAGEAAALLVVAVAAAGMLAPLRADLRGELA